MTQRLPPPLKWAGGKRWLVPHVMPYWEAHRGRRLVEPFVGGLAMTLGLAPERALLNDLNPHLIAFYTRLQTGLAVDDAVVPLENDRAVYARNRDRFNALVADGAWQSEEAAALFYYLNRTGFNGLCRFNAAGFFNVPFGRYRSIPYRRDFAAYREALRGYAFTAGPFDSVDVSDGDFVYADPPYDVEFTSYSASRFVWADQVRLAHWLAALTVPVVASNQATPRVLALYRELGFAVTTLAAPRRISCDGNRADALEMLALRGF